MKKSFKRKRVVAFFVIMETGNVLLLENKTMNKDNTPFFLAIGAGIIASLCCLGPVLLVAFGLSGVSFALSIGQYSWLFLTFGTLFLVIALFFYYRKKKCCSVSGIKQHWKQILLTFIIMVAILFIIKYWLATYLAKMVYE